ncbi:MAG: DoxX family protein [Gemmatimonadales bacterium]
MISAPRSTRSLIALRCLVSLHLLIHGTFRAQGDGYVSGFGEFLSGSGVPAGLVVAWSITLFEIIGSLLLAWGWQQRWIALGFVAELAVGIAMVHLNEGWFVVGGGRNGAEYSVLIIGVMLAIAWAEPRARETAAFDRATSTI